MRSAALITMCLLAIACGGGDRYDIVSGGEDNVVYRIDKRTGEVILVQGGKGWLVLSPESPAPEEFATADLHKVEQIHTELDSDTYYLQLYNGTDIEFSEVTFRVHTVHNGMKQVRLYRWEGNIQPFAVDRVTIAIRPDDAPPGQVAIVSAKGIRRDT